jgi:hypothetical protein
VWFTHNPPPAGHPYEDRVYYNRTANDAWLQPGTYAVVGPRINNWIGSEENTGSESNHRITIDNANNPAVHVTTHSGGNHYPAAANIQPVLGIIAGAKMPVAWGFADPTSPPANEIPWIGFSISEPLRSNYYPHPDATTPGAKDTNLLDAYGSPHNLPLDGQAPNPLSYDGLLVTGTRYNYRTLFLQRLANPLLPWNPLPNDPNHDPGLTHNGVTVVNPYITIDWMPMDLSVFNGEYDQRPTTWAQDPDEFDPDLGNPENRVHFASRLRGLPPGNPRGLPPRRLWNPFSDDPVGNAQVGSSSYVFDYDLRHTLGFLNTHYGPIPTVAPAANPGDPQQPFEWLQWNDRPFISQYELMLVPSSAPGKLLYEYSVVAAAPPDPYVFGSGAAASDADRFAGARLPFGHLLNFFQSGDTTPTDYGSGNFQRLFEYTHAPSRFVGTEVMLQPNGTAFGAVGPETSSFRPPFNSVAAYRQPGALNVNTVISAKVFEGGLLHRQLTNPGLPYDPATNPYVPGSGHPGPQWSDFLESRGGYAGAGMLAFDPDVPTFVANPFRSAGAGEFVPLPSLERRGAECTLLRSRTIDPAARQPNPLFYRSLVGAGNEHRDTNRHPYFRYQGIQRLGNLVTTRSNVYAVWMTVGFFEVEPDATNNTAVYPDGYRLGREMGSDAGEIKRHRAFYIIDRSIPVAFEPGENHNVDRAVVLRRFIE